MLELTLLTLVAAVATTFAVDILRPTMKLVMRRRTSRHATTRTIVDGHEVEAHPAH